MKSRRRSFIRALSLVLGLASAGPALAQDPIEQAIGYWLANDDAAAFPALSALAEGGDERAMLFLGAIEPRSLDSAFLAGLDRETRNRMLRAPGGLSGKSWLSRVTSDTGLASALLAARSGDPTPLLALNQLHAASEGVLATYNAAPWSLVGIDRVTPVPETLRHLVWHGADLALSTEISGLTLSADQQAEYRAALAEAAEPQNGKAACSWRFSNPCTHHTPFCPHHRWSLLSLARCYGGGSSKCARWLTLPLQHLRSSKPPSRRHAPSWRPPPRLPLCGDSALRPARWIRTAAPPQSGPSREPA